MGGQRTSKLAVQHEGKSGQTPGGSNRSRDREKRCLLAYFPWLTQPASLNHPEWCSGVAPFTEVAWSLTHQSLTKKMPMALPTGQSDASFFSIGVSLFLDSPNLHQAEKNPSRHNWSPWLVHFVFSKWDDALIHVSEGHKEMGVGVMQRWEWWVMTFTECTQTSEV